MGIDQWEWEGMGILIVFPHTSTRTVNFHILLIDNAERSARCRKLIFSNSESAMNTIGGTVVARSYDCGTVKCQMS